MGGRRTVFGFREAAIDPTQGWRPQVDQRDDSTPRDPDGGPLPFERRRHDRWSAGGIATAFCVAGESFGQRCTLALLDESLDGMGARSGRPLAPGTLVSIAFAEPGIPMKTGVVLRCLPCGDGYRLAIQFEARLAA